jgi:hypothetical protein
MAAQICAADYFQFGKMLLLATWENCVFEGACNS